VATPEFRLIRPHTGYRRDLTEERTREQQRAEKLLESAAIKLSSVVTDLHGVTGRDIMDHLIAGERNAKVLAQLARTAARRKISQLEEALEGAEFFTADHAALLSAMLARTSRRIGVPPGAPQSWLMSCDKWKISDAASSGISRWYSE